MENIKNARRTVSLDRTIEDSDLIDSRTGTFLVLERYPDDQGRMVIIEELDRASFLDRAWPDGDPDRPEIPDMVEAFALSDILVQAFDASMVTIPGYEFAPVFAVEFPGSRLIHQHST